MPPGHALAKSSPALQLHLSGSASRHSFLFRIKLIPYCTAGRQNASIPCRAIIPRHNPTEINSTSSAQAFQSLTPLRWVHLQSITRPLLSPMDEQLKMLKPEPQPFWVPNSPAPHGHGLSGRQTERAKDSYGSNDTFTFQ